MFSLAARMLRARPITFRVRVIRGGEASGMEN